MDKRVTYKLATQKDIEEYYGKVPATMKAMIFYVDGEPAGIGGYRMLNGSFVIFSEIKENVKVSKQTIWRCAKIVMDMIAREKTTMYAVAGNERFCEKLGMKRFHGETYQWLN